MQVGSRPFEDTTMNRIDSSVTQDGDGDTFVSCDLPVAVADELIALLRANPTPSIEPLVNALAATLNDAYTAVLADVLGCPDLMPGSEALVLVEDAIIESTDGGMAVLLPGAYNPRDAATKALAAIADHATGHGVDMHDPNLSVNIHPARWMILHHCDAADHDFHPQESDAGNPGAILVTRVDLELDYGLFDGLVTSV
jgi:hypothetical protein